MTQKSDSSHRDFRLSTYLLICTGKAIRQVSHNQKSPSPSSPSLRIMVKVPVHSSGYTHLPESSVALREFLLEQLEKTLSRRPATIQGDVHPSAVQNLHITFHLMSEGNSSSGRSRGQHHECEEFIHQMKQILRSPDFKSFSHEVIQTVRKYIPKLPENIQVSLRIA